MYEKLATEKRHLGREHSAKRLRKEGVVPGVIYGKEIESLPIKVPHAKLNKFLDKAGRVFEVEIQGGKTHLVHLDSLQWDHMGNQLLHIAFHKLQAGEKTTVSLPVNWVGESVGQREGGIIHQQTNEIEVEGLPKDIPEQIEVDVSELDMNDSLHLSDIAPPKGCTWVTDESLTIVSCQPPKPEEVPEEAVSPAETPELAEEGAEGEGAEEGAEGEGAEGEGESSSEEGSSEEETKKAS